MTITKTIENEKITLKLEGWLDTLAAPELGKEIGEITEAKEIVLDFDKLEYISSSGLRQVAACHKKSKDIGAALSIINVCKEVLSIFQMTGIDKKFNIIGK